MKGTVKVILLLLVSTAYHSPGQDSEPSIEFETPSETVERGASWSVRVDVDPSFRTSLTILLSGTEAGSRISVFRFDGLQRTKASIDLVYGPKVQPPVEAPIWLRDLAADEDMLGADGTQFTITYADKSGSHKINRWSADIRTKERDLEKFVEFTNGLMKQTGIFPRRLFINDKWSENMIEVRIPVSPSFVRAANRIEKQHEFSVGELLSRMCLVGSKGETIRYNPADQVVSGKAEQLSAVSLVEVLGRLNFASEEHTFDRLNEVASADDPFRIKKESPEAIE